jgi:hypothetical protein
VRFAAADLALTDDEDVVARELDRLLDEVWARGPGAEDDPALAQDELWTRLRGWTSLAERPLPEQCVALELIGAHLVPATFPATVGLLAPLLRLVSTQLFAALVDGRLRGTAGVLEGSGRSWPPGGALLGAEGAEVVALVEGTTVHLVVPGVVERAASADLTRSFGRVTVASGDALEPPRHLDEAHLEHWLACAAVALAADMAGGARALCGLAVGHAAQRVQFGRPIGTFQAVQHRLVAMTMLAQRAAAAVQYAAAALEAGGPHATAAAHVAKGVAAQAVARCGRDALQLHGATGYTWDNDVHRYLRRGYASDAAFGDRHWHRARLVQRIVEAEAHEEDQERSARHG